MKKIISLMIVTMFLATTLPAQKLLDIYKKGTVKLIPDENYGKGNNWDKVFETYNDTLYGKHLGARKSIKMMPDGSIVVNHAYKHFFSLFGPDGRFKKELTVKYSSGKILKRVKNIAGVLDDQIFYTGLDNMGQMDCFDFEGNHLKELKLDYMTKQIIPLPGRKLAVVGWVIWSDRFRDFVSIVDYETNEEKVIWEHFTKRDMQDCTYKDDMFHYGYHFKEGGAMSMSTMPNLLTHGLRPAAKITFVKNELIIALPPTGEIFKYNVEGKLLDKFKVNWENPEITVEKQKEIQLSAIKRVEEGLKMSDEKDPKAAKFKEAYTSILKDMKSDLSKINKPIPQPYFSTFIKDSDNNLLFFEYPEEEGENKFNVYTFDNDGKFVCQSTFVCDDYNLVINNNRLIFKDGYLYGIQNLKEADGIPMRLVKFKLSN